LQICNIANVTNAAISAQSRSTSSDDGRDEEWIVVRSSAKKDVAGSKVDATINVDGDNLQSSDESTKLNRQWLVDARAGLLWIKYNVSITFRTARDNSNRVAKWRRRIGESSIE
jgi:hypothetical protein